MKMGNYTGKPSLAASSIVVDRCLGLISMIFLAVLLSPIIANYLIINFAIDISKIFLILLVAVLLLFSVIYVFRSFFKTHLAALSSLLKQHFNPSSYIVAIFISIVGHILFASSYYLLFQVFDHTTLSTVMSIVVYAQLSNVIPISFLGFSPGEGSVVAIAGLFGIAHQSSLAVIATVVAAKYLFALSGFISELAVDGSSFIKLHLIRPRNTLE